MHFDVVVTRHAGLLEFLAEEGHTWDEVVQHVIDSSILEDKDVLGVLPVNLAAKCKSFTEVALEIPVELRGQELSCQQVRDFQRGTFSYVVMTLEKSQDLDRQLTEKGY